MTEHSYLWHIKTYRCGSVVKFHFEQNALRFSNKIPQLERQGKIATAIRSRNVFQNQSKHSVDFNETLWWLHDKW